MTSTVPLRSLSAKRSPARRSFELNPFRIFRLPVGASTDDAASLAEGALTLEKVGLSLDEPDPMPWLAKPSTYEMQQAAQIIEEPLARLQRQMAWFDMERIPNPERLRAVLADPFGEDTSALLHESIELPQITGPSPSRNNLALIEQVVEIPAEKAPICPSCGLEGAPDRTRCKACSTPYELVDMGGAPAAAARPEKARDVAITLDMPFWDGVFGGKMTITVSLPEACTACAGTGMNPTEMMPCSACGSDLKRRKTCLRCAGTGSIGVPCEVCRKSGTVKTERKLEIVTPPGIGRGTLLRLPGEGNPRGQADLYVTVVSGSHDYFTRLGGDIVTTMSLNSVELAQGEPIEVATLDGPVRVQLPLKTKHGDIFCLRGRGCVNSRGGRRGDHYFRVAVTANDSKLYRLATERAAQEVAERSVTLNAAFASATSPASAPPPPVPKADLVLIARIVNQSNLKILLATVRTDAAIDGVAVRLTVPAPALTPERWSKTGNLAVLRDAHNLIAGAPSEAEDAATVAALWGQALQTWMRLLSHSWFHAYVESSISALNDDFATADDVEAVEDSVRNQLLDLSVQQIRFLVLEGRYALAGAMIKALAEADIDSRLLTPSMRPLRSVFQSELAELEPLIEDSGDGVADTVDTYFQQLEPICIRWRQLDPKGIVGLSDLLDDAVEKGYLRLRNAEETDIRVDDVLKRANKLVAARSLSDRFQSFQKELEQRRKNICHYCKIDKPNWEKSVVLSGKKETGRERNFNRTTIFYSTTKAFVLRCDKCADRHEYIRKTVHGIYWTGLAAAGIWVFGLMALPGSASSSDIPASISSTSTSDAGGSSAGTSPPAISSPGDSPNSSSNTGASSQDGSSSQVTWIRDHRKKSGNCIIIFSASSSDLPDNAGACLAKVESEMSASPELQLAIIGSKTDSETVQLAKQRVLNTAVAFSDVPDERLVLSLGSGLSLPIVETFYVVRKHSTNNRK